MGGRTTIGLDIGTSGVRAAELSIGRDVFALERFGQVTLAEGAVRDGEVVDPVAVAEAIQHLWSATKFRSKKVSLGVSNHRVVVRPIELPQMPTKELKQALPYQVGEMIPMPVEEAVLDFHPLEMFSNGTDQMVKGMLVAASRDTVMANVSAVQRAGLDPVSVDLTPFAVLRAVARPGDLSVGTEALVDIGAQVTNVIIHTAGVPKFVRILLMGGQDISDSLAERMGITLGEAEALKQSVGLNPAVGDLQNAVRTISSTAQSLIDEIRGSLDYYSGSNPAAPVNQVTVSGGASQLPGLLQRLAESTNLPVRGADPLDLLQIGSTGLSPEQLAMVRPLSAVPVGLALGAV